MNNFQSIQSGQGMLKTAYPSSGENPVLTALKRRRDNLTNKVTTPTKDKIEDSESEPS